MNWEERPVKAKARDWLLEKIPEYEDGIKYLGLPAGKAIFEKKMAEYRKLDVLALFEMNKSIWKELRKTTEAAVEAKVFPKQSYALKGSIDSYLNYGHVVYDYNVVWLDYCGPITPDRLKSLRTALKLRPKNGVVAVTFMAGRERPNGNTILDFFDDSYMGTEIDYDKDLIPSYFLRRVRAISELASGVDRGIDIRVLPYKDKVPMMLFVFKDMNGVRPIVDVEPYLKE